MAQTGADVLELDHQVGIEDAVNACGPDMVIWGNLDPVGVLLSATPEEVAEATIRVLEQVRESGHLRFVASSGCTLAMGTPRENLHSMIAAVCDYHDATT